jgi:hypothetical protein
MSGGTLRLLSMPPRDARHVEGPLIELGAGDHAIFGYGSLLSLSSLERTLGRAYSGPFVPCSVLGWRRSWDVTMPNRTRYVIQNKEQVFPEHILYLNVRRQALSIVNGVVFVITGHDLLSYDEREWIYNRVPVNDFLSGVQVRGGQVWMYEGKEEYVVSLPSDWREAAVRSSYLTIVKNGLNSLSPDFAQEFWANTDPIPEWLVVDDQEL